MKGWVKVFPFNRRLTSFVSSLLFLYSLKSLVKIWSKVLFTTHFFTLLMAVRQIGHELTPDWNDWSKHDYSGKVKQMNDWVESQWKDKIRHTLQILWEQTVVTGLLTKSRQQTHLKLTSNLSNNSWKYRKMV